jgi:hypothetical protein
MMAGPVANVRNVITIEGVDHASGAIDKAKKSLDGLEAGARKAGKGVKDAGAHAKGAFSHGLPGLEGKHDVFNRLASAAGGAGGALQESAHGVALLDAGMRLLPGPLGAAAAGIVAVGAAIFLVNKHLNEASAKLALLGDAHTGELAKGLGIDEDAAIKLGQALNGLSTKSLRPTDALLRQVARNAERMGLDAGKAATELVKAWEGGPDALRKFQAEYGKLAGLATNTADLAASVGVSAEALGLVKAQTQADRERVAVSESLLRIQQLQVEIGAADQTARKAGYGREAQAIRESANARSSAAKANIDNERVWLAAVNARAIAEREAAAVAEDAARRQAESLARLNVFEAQANATLDDGIATQTHAAILVKRQEIAAGALLAFNVANQGVLTGTLLVQRQGLQIALAQSEAAVIASAKASGAALSAKRKQAAAEALTTRNAIADANLRTLRAQVDRDGLQTQRERIALLDVERAKAIGSTASIKNARARNATLLAIDEEYATARAKLDRDIAKEEADLQSELGNLLDDQAKRSVAIAKSASDAVLATARARATSLADVLRTQGKDDEAAAVERRQARADHNQALIAIDQERIAALADNVGDVEEAAAIEAEADQKRIQAKLALADVERRLAADSQARAVAARADAAASLQGPIDALRQLSSLGAVSAGGEGLAAVVKGFTELDAAMSKSEVNASEVADAIGGTLTGVAGAAIDADTKRTTAAIDADTKRRLSTATTEDERAAIVADAEQRKAAAVDAAERRKAGISAAVEVAKGIAAAASYDFVGAAGHGAAAIAFGAIAGGAGGSVPTASAGGGGFNAPSQGQGQGSAQASGSVTNVFNFNQPLATQQAIGKAVHGSLKSLGGTGTDKGRGA